MPNTNPQLTTENLNQLPQPASIRPEHLAPVIRINRVSINKTLTGIWPQALEKPVTLKEPEILDGAGLNSLAEDIREYKTASGDMIWAATDKGINYKDHNEDRVGVSPQDNMAVVADGMGGYGKGDEAAQIAVEAFQDYPEDPNEAAKSASQLMKSEGIGSGGACYASAKITEDQGQKYVNISKAGDVKVMIIENGQLIWESHDDSTVQELLDIDDPKNPFKITEDQALYHPSRNVVTNCISSDKNSIQVLKPMAVNKGTIVLLLTDGVIDNMTPKEIVKKIRGAKGRQIIQVISNITDRRMRDSEKIAAISGARIDIKALTQALSSVQLGAEEHKRYLDLQKKYELYKKLQEERIATGSYSDRFETEPKPDNIGMVVVEIN